MIVFVIAMESEAEPIIANMQVKKRMTCCGRAVVLGKMCGKKTAVVVCGVGKVNAAAGAQYAIDCLGADKIVNVGVAGGTSDNLQIGGIYAISRAVQYDFDLTQLNGTPMGTLNEYAEPYIELAVCGAFPAKSLATADRFNDDKADYKLITKVLDAQIRDMEGGAIAHVCKRAGVLCYSFKAISDLANLGTTTEQFKNNLSLCAAALESNACNIFKAVDLC